MAFCTCCLSQLPAPILVRGDATLMMARALGGDKLDFSHANTCCCHRSHARICQTRAKVLMQFTDEILIKVIRCADHRCWRGGNGGGGGRCVCVCSGIYSWQSRQQKPPAENNAHYISVNFAGVRSHKHMCVR